MMPSMVAIGTYAVLLAWNEYLYAFPLLSNDTDITLPVALGNFLSADDSPWELLMTTGFIYALPARRGLLRLPPLHDRRPHRGRREVLGYRPCAVGHGRCHPRQGGPAIRFTCQTSYHKPVYSRGMICPSFA